MKCFLVFGALLVQALPAFASDLKPTVQLPARQSHPVPALLVFGGFESAGKVLSLLHPSVPMVLASFDYPFKASRNLRFPESLKDLPEAKKVFPETVAGIRGLVTRVASIPEVDPARIVVVGASFGAPFALAAAAEDPRISGVVIADGFGRLAPTAENVILRAWLPRYGWPAKPAAWLLSRALQFYLGLQEPESYAERLRKGQRVLMISAERDSFIPRESTDSLARALARSQAQVEQYQMPGEHLMPGASAAIAKMVAMIESWLRPI